MSATTDSPVPGETAPADEGAAAPAAGVEEAAAPVVASLRDGIPLPTEWPELADPELLERMIEIIAEEGKVERSKITPEATLETLGLESMDVVMILMGVEDKLGTYIPMDAELTSARNLSEFVDAVAKASAKSAAAKPPASPETPAETPQ